MRPAGAYVRCVAVVALVLVAALWLGEPWLVALAVPFAIAAARPRPAGEAPTIALHLARRRVEHGSVVDTEVDVSEPPGVGLVTAELVPGETRLVGGNRWAAGTSHRVRLRASRIGTRNPGWVRTTTWDELLQHTATWPAVEAPSLRVLPQVAAVSASEALPSSRGYAGEHISRSAGAGVEFAGVRAFATGDRPRLVDWRLTARTGVPHVRTTRQEHSVRVCVLVDTTCSGDLGRQLVELAARAALGLARSYLVRGDSVSLVEFGGRDRRFAAVSGRSQLPRVQDWLADLAPRTNVALPPAPPRTGPCDLAIAVSPLVEASAAQGLVTLRQRGVGVAVLATLPPGGLVFARDRDTVEDVASRLWALRRETTIHGLRRLGVPVVPWDDSADLDLALRTMARQARAPRLATR